METKRLILALSALCICVARGQTGNDAESTDCNGKSFRCVDPGSYVQCDADPNDPNHTIVGDSDTLICDDDTICDDSADSPCTPNETPPEETPSDPEPTESPSEGNNPGDGNDGGEPTETSSEGNNPDDGGEPTETPNEPTEGNNPDDGSDVTTPGDDDGAVETTSENSEGEPDTTEGDDGPTDTNGGESTSESTTSSDDNNSPTTSEPEQPTTTSEAPEFTCPGVGRFPHPTDCSKYNFCWDLEHPYVTFTCKSKLVFNAILGRCSSDWSACANAPQCVANHQVLADPSDNSTYFYCRNVGSPLLPQFVLYKRKCEKHATFDPSLLVCVPNEDGEGSDSSESHEHHEKVKFECKEAGIFPDLSDETKYYECIVKNVAKGKLKTKHHNCPKDQVFSLQDLACIPILVGEITDDRS